MKVRVKVWLEEDGQLIFGKGKLDLLSAIVQTGSISQGAKKLKMSYRRAWSYLCAIEKRLGQPLLIRKKGGSDGGGTVLTPYAKELLEKFYRLDKETYQFIQSQYSKIFKM